MPFVVVLVAFWTGNASAAAPTISLTATPSSVAAGDSVTLQATVSVAGGPAPTSGYVTFTRRDGTNQTAVKDNGNNQQFQLTPLNGTDSTATLMTTSFAAGTFTITATYAPGSGHPYTSAPASLVVGGVTLHITTLTLTSNPATINAGDAPTLNATVVQSDGGTGVPTGVVTFDDNGVILGNGALVNGVATITPTGFGAGPHVLHASYVGDSADLSSAGSYSLVVSSVTNPAVDTTTTLVAAPSQIVSGTSVQLTAHVVQFGTPTAPPGGMVIFYNSTGGTDVYVGEAAIDSNGDASFDVAGWVTGSYDLKASYLGDITDGFNGSAGNASLSVITPPTTATLVYTGDTNVVYGNTATLSASLVATVGGAPAAGQTVTLTLGSQHCTAVTDAAGTATCPVNVTDPSGSYTATAIFAGGTAYAATNATGSVTVSTRPSTVHIAAASAQTGSNLTLSATLLDGSAPIASKTVTLSFGAQTCSATTNASGVASCAVPVSVAAGSYPTAAAFAGDTYYSASSDTGSATVIAQATTLQLASVGPVRYGDSATLGATLLAGSTPVAGKTVTLTLGTQTCTATTNASGVASCGLTVTQPAGSYTTTASFAGDSPYASSTTSGSATVTTRPTTTHLTAVGTVVTGNNAALGATLLDGPTPVANRTVTLKLGTLICTAVTNASGVATCVVTVTQSPGSYATSAGFAGDSYYSASSDAGTATVATRPTTLGLSAPASVQSGSSVTLAGTLSDGAPVAGKTITLTLGTQTCIATTNASGAATCAIVVTQLAGAYATAASFAGDSTYSPGSATGSISVTAAPGPRTTNSTITASGPLTIGNTATLTGGLFDGTTPIAGKVLKLALGSNTCTTGVTNTSGIASCTVTVTAPAGTYVTTASFAGDSAYKTSTGTGTVTVVLRPSTIQLTVPSSVPSAGSVTISGTLLDGTTPLAGKTVKLSLGNQSCTATTGATGVLTCVITLSQPAGSYASAASFTGDASYAASSDSATVIVTGKATSLTLTAPASVVTGSSITLSGKLLYGSSNLKNELITFSLGSQSCTATTNGSGAASCTITVTQPAGSYTAVASFAGDSTYSASTDTGTATVTSPSNDGHHGDDGHHYGDDNHGGTDNHDGSWPGSHSNGHSSNDSNGNNGRGENSDVGWHGGNDGRGYDGWHDGVGDSGHGGCSNSGSSHGSWL